MSSRATVFAPGSIGNVGPGFDVLGLAVEGIGDRVTVELTDGEARVVAVTGRDAAFVPTDAARNCCVIAARAMLRMYDVKAEPVVGIHKGLALAGGMGGSGASSVGGALAAALAAGLTPRPLDIMAAALEGESAVAGRHLDNIASSLLGGLTITRSVDPIDVVGVPVAAAWWVALVTPSIRIRTEEARAILPKECDRAIWIQLMANTTALAHAFSVGDASLLARALDDVYAERHRARLIPHFGNVKRAALDAGALGCSISGSGPSVFAIASDQRTATRCAEAMRTAFDEVDAATHVGPIAKRGARRIDD